MKKINALALTLVAACISTNASAVSQGYILRAGETLAAGNWLESKNGIYELHMQASDGNLVLYRRNRDFGSWHPTGWSSGKKGAGATVRMQEDGNLVMLRNGNVVWASNTGGRPWDTAFRLVLRPYGAMDIYDSAGQRNTLHTDYGNGGPWYTYPVCQYGDSRFPDPQVGSVIAYSGYEALNDVRAEHPGKNLCYFWDNN